MTTLTPAYEKSIAYDKESCDFAMYLDGVLQGYARTHHEAKVTLDTIVYDLLTHPHVANAEAVG